MISDEFRLAVVSKVNSLLLFTATFASTGRFSIVGLTLTGQSIEFVEASEPSIFMAGVPT